jgi:uncharacterized membrane protein YfcA
VNDLVSYGLAGFAAQIVDGMLGMGFGVTSTSILLAAGLPPKIASSTVHAAECFTTAASGISHHCCGNIDKKLFWSLLVPGILGAVTGAYILCQLPGDKFKPVIGFYMLFMGAFIMWRVFKAVQPKEITTHIRPLGFFGAFVDALGGGGWGPIVASTLVARGNNAKKTVGTVNAVEFFVTVSASITFFLSMGLGHWQIIASLATGGVIAAPIAAYMCSRVPHRPFMFMVGLLVMFMSGRTLAKVFGLPFPV